MAKGKRPSIAQAPDQDRDITEGDQFFDVLEQGSNGVVSREALDMPEAKCTRKESSHSLPYGPGTWSEVTFPLLSHSSK